MVVHQAVGMADPIVPLVGVLEGVQEVDTVLIGPEDRLPLIAAGGHMVDTACKLNAKGSGHATKDRPSMPHHET